VYTGEYGSLWFHSSSEQTNVRFMAPTVYVVFFCIFAMAGAPGILLVEKTGNRYTSNRGPPESGMGKTPRGARGNPGPPLSLQVEASIITLEM
jgi:hypothetical protein